MARSDAGGGDGPGDPGARGAGPEPTDPLARAGDADLMHPARHFRRAQWVGPSGPFAASDPPGGRIELRDGPATPAAHGRTSDTGDVRGGGSPDFGGGEAAGPSHRGRTALIAVLGLAVAVGVASGAVALRAQSPSALPSSLTAVIPAAAAGDGIGNLHMYSTTTGWAQRLEGGTILHTTRGVQRWTASSPPSSDQILAVAYVDPDTARVLTVAGEVGSRATVQTWGTVDGGASWSRGGSFDVQGFSAAAAGALDFIDAEHGWYSQLEAAAGFAGTALFRTVDGGAQWSEVAASGGGTLRASLAGVIPGGCDGLTAAFATDTTGWLTGTCLSASAPLYVTRDDGATWTVQPLPSLPPSPAGGTSFSPVFTSAERGTLVTENQSLTGVSTSLFATADGGLTWVPRATLVGTPITDDFLDADHGWLVIAGDGAAGATDLYQTVDGGATWTRVGAFPYMGLNLDFLTPEAGWAAVVVGQQESGPAYLVQTGDGGRAWTGVVPRLTLQSAPSP